MLTKNTFLFTGTALGSSCSERKGRAHSRPHTWEPPGAAAASPERSLCLANRHLSRLERVLRASADPVHFLLLVLLHSPTFSSALPSADCSIHPLCHIYIYFSLCFSHLSFAVTHQECVGEEYVRVPSGHSEGFFLTLRYL